MPVTSDVTRPRAPRLPAVGSLYEWFGHQRLKASSGLLDVTARPRRGLSGTQPSETIKTAKLTSLWRHGARPTGAELVSSSTVVEQDAHDVKQEHAAGTLGRLC